MDRETGKEVMNRRTFVKTAAVSSLSLSGACQSNQLTDIIDTHTHFYDPTRPEGIPWPGKKSPLYRKVYPKDLMKVASKHGVTGTVVVEASNVLEDNQWILDIAKDNKSIVGFVGSVEPTIDDWNKHISRFAKNELFRGIRVNKSLQKLNDSQVIKNFSRMSAMDLSVDLNKGIYGLEAAVELSRKVPSLRIVIDHLPYNLKEKDVERYNKALEKISEFPNIFAKVSTVLFKVNGKTVDNPLLYKQRLDRLWETFGEDRLIYGSNWPVSDVYNGSYSQVFKVVDTYFSAKGPEVREKYFAGNASKAYKWIKR